MRFAHEDDKKGGMRIRKKIERGWEGRLKMLAPQDNSNGNVHSYFLIYDFTPAMILTMRSPAFPSHKSGSLGDL